MGEIWMKVWQDFQNLPEVKKELEARFKKAESLPPDMRRDWLAISRFLGTKGYDYRSFTSVEATYDALKQYVKNERMNRSVQKHIDAIDGSAKPDKAKPKTKRKTDKRTATKDKATKLFARLYKTMKGQAATNRVNKELNTDYSLKTLLKYSAKLVR